MRLKFDLIGILKIWAGSSLIFLTGGIGLVILGLLPLAGIVAIVGILTAGVLSAADIAALSAIGALYVLIAVPLTLYAAALIDSGLQAVLGRSLGIHKAVKRGADRIPVVGKPAGAAIGDGQ